MRPKFKETDENKVKIEEKLYNFVFTKWDT